MTAWQRVVPHRPTDVLAGCFGVLAVAGIVLILVMTLDGTGDPLAAVVVCGFLALIAAFMWRLGRVGGYVSDRGVRVQYMVGSDVVDWPDVRRFVVRPSRRGRIIGMESEEIWVVRRTGDPIETQLGHLTRGPQLASLSWRLFTAATRTRDGDFEQAFGHLEDARVRYTGQGSV